ncbi:MAG: hypothetical protein WDW38_004278 [Sanguina aurantia]
MAALFQFPRDHCFQVVGSGGELFVSDAIAAVEQTCQESIIREKLKVTPRLGGKYSSIMMDIKVRAPEIIEMRMGSIDQYYLAVDSAVLPACRKINPEQTLTGILD